MRKLWAAAALMVLAVYFAGCNTAEGVGRDIERVGEEIQEEA